MKEAQQIKMNMTQLKKGDTVSILSGKDKGKTGKVLEVNRRTGKIVVEAVNVHTRFERAKGNNVAGQKITFPAPMSSSKAILVCPSCGKSTRIGHKFLDNGQKQRVCKKCGKAI